MRLTLSFATPLRSRATEMSSVYKGKAGHVQCEQMFTDDTRCINHVHSRRPQPRICDDCLEAAKDDPDKTPPAATKTTGGACVS